MFNDTNKVQRAARRLIGSKRNPLPPRQVPGTDSEPPGRCRSARGLGKVPGAYLGALGGWKVPTGSDPI